MILITIITLGVIGAISAILLYATSKKFEVYEDPRIAKVQEVLPGANCGGCGFAGCSNFAGACVKAGSLDGLRCPVGGNAVMEKVAQIIGSEVSDSEPMVAVIRCNGTCQARPKSNIYDGSKSCAIASSLYGGETGCSFGCLGFGDCVKACAFDAIHINKETGIAEVDEEKCTSCGACVKGAVARKACNNACIGCGKCAKECPAGAITIENNVAYIDFQKCRLCRKCVAACPTGAIQEVNFPPKKEVIQPEPAATTTEANNNAIKTN